MTYVCINRGPMKELRFSEGWILRLENLEHFLSSFSPMTKDLSAMV